MQCDIGSQSTSEQQVFPQISRVLALKMAWVSTGARTGLNGKRTVEVAVVPKQTANECAVGKGASGANTLRSVTIVCVGPLPSSQLHFFASRTEIERRFLPMQQRIGIYVCSFPIALWVAEDCYREV